MKTVTADELLEREAAADPSFRAEWERLAPARALSVELIRYRSRHDLTQTALGRVLGVSQARVAQLESGERNPDLDTIAKVAAALDIEFIIDVRPAGRPARLTTKRATTRGTTGTVAGAEITAAAA
ncbi:MAG: helix-turn-helix transcriptional regulator [Patulibacter sp.]